MAEQISATLKEEIMTMKLEQINRQYHSFVDDQVLTSGHLNAIIDYFEDQDRLSRILLTGTGIVCGLKLEKVTDNTIVMTQGMSVTTDGDLLFLDQNPDGKNFGSLTTSSFSFKYVRAFEDLNAEYARFKDSEGVTYPLNELLLTDEEGAQPLAQLLQSGDDYCVVLYLESYPQQGDLCTTESCDNQGVKQVNKLRVLLLRKQDVVEIAKKDPLFSAFDVAGILEEIPVLQMPRIILNANNTTSIENLKKAYLNSFPAASGVVNDLKNGLKLLANRLFAIKIDNAVWKRIINNLDKISSNVTDQGFQYHYDVLCDLVDTWNELRAVLPKIAGYCAPDPQAFPKHILIGNLKSPKKLRHQFYKSSALKNEDESIAYCSSLVERLVVLSENFQLKDGDIKITPSLLHAAVDKKAIPFYYKPNDALPRMWNFEKTSHSEENTHLGYHSHQWSSLPQVVEPLKYRLSSFDFFRIEGHQGKNYQAALDDIMTKRDLYGLSFDVKAIALQGNETDIDIEDYACEFEDLELLLKVWTEEQDCILSEVTQLFTGFDTAEPGKNDFRKVSEVVEMKVTEEVIDPIRNKVTGDSRKTLVAAGASSGSVLGTGVGNMTTKALLFRQNAVADSIVASGTAVGRYIEASNLDVRNLPASVVAGIYKQEAEKSLDSSVWEGKEEIKELTVEMPLELYARIEKVAAYVPNRIADIDRTSTNKYMDSLDDLCQYVKNLKVRYQSAASKGLSPEVQAMTALMINQLSGICCSGSKLQTLQAEIEKRKEAILSRLTLSQFVKEHPGLDHAAGVPPGGTFVLVYVNKQSKTSGSTAFLPKDQQKQILEIFSPREIVEIRNYYVEQVRGATSRMMLKSATGKEVKSVEPNQVFADMTKVIQREKNVAISAQMIERIVSGRINGIDDKKDTTTDVPEQTVVADFYLPYRCCSDCAPINFVVQKPPVFLQLDKDRICLDEETVQVGFAASPTDAVVTTDPEMPGVQIVENMILLDPKKIPTDAYEVPIHFSVNGQLTAAELVLYKKPTVTFKVPASPVVDPAVVFTPDEIELGAQYEWDFGDGTHSYDPTVRHEYQLPVNEKNVVTVTLKMTAANGVCTATASHEIEFEIRDDYPPENCIDDTITAIHKDLELLRKIDSRNSKLLFPLWQSTAEMYGGTPDYTNGILDQPAFLEGGLDDQLYEFFWDRIRKVIRYVISPDSDQGSHEFSVLMQLLELQLKLVYHVLQCQKEDAVGKYSEQISRLLNAIMSLYDEFSERGISFSSDFIAFLKDWGEKVKNVELFRKHSDQTKIYF